MKTRRYSPSVNAGSMADIAFLLLIFFLVATTISADKGILRKLPSECPSGENCSKPLLDRNVLRILINKDNAIMVNEAIVQLSEVKQLAKDFLDNNGDGACDYCNGKKNTTSSQSPQKAIISLQTDPLASYEMFINVQDELTLAYYDLRLYYAKSKFNKLPEALSKAELIEVKEAYPFLLSEAKTVRGN